MIAENKEFTVTGSTLDEAAELLQDYFLVMNRMSKAVKSYESDNQEISPAPEPEIDGQFEMPQDYDKMMEFINQFKDNPDSSMFISIYSQSKDKEYWG